MYNLATDILTGYKDCYAPFGGRWSNEQKHHLNLLSAQGEQVLDALKNFKKTNGPQLENGKTITDIEKQWKHNPLYLKSHKPLLEILTGITAPEHLDLLFKDYSPLFEKIIQLHNRVTCAGMKNNTTLSIVSGCHNACPHCGVEAVAPYGIACLPFPLVKQIRLFQQKKNKAWRYYYASDPLDYYDPIYQGSFLSKNSGIAIITKGFRPERLANKQHPLYEAELKRYDALAAFNDNNGTSILSCVDFGWESFENSFQRLYANLKLLHGNCTVQYYGQDEKAKQYFLNHMHNVDIRNKNMYAFGKVEMIGRASSLTYQDFVTNNFIFAFQNKLIVLEADGGVYYQSYINQDCGCRPVWQSIGNIFQPEILVEHCNYLSKHGKSTLKNTDMFPFVIQAYKSPFLKDSRKLSAEETLGCLPKGKMIDRKYSVTLPVLKSDGFLSYPNAPSIKWDITDKGILKDLQEGLGYTRTTRGTLLEEKQKGEYYTYHENSGIKPLAGIYFEECDFEPHFKINNPYLKKLRFLYTVPDVLDLTPCSRLEELRFEQIITPGKILLPQQVSEQVKKSAEKVYPPENIIYAKKLSPSLLRGTEHC